MAHYHTLGVREKRVSLHTSQLRPIRPELILLFIAWSNLEYFSSPLYGMRVHCRAIPTPSIKSSGTHSYTWVERGTMRVIKSVLPKNTTQCPRPRLEPGPLVLESSALAMSQTNLPPQGWTGINCPSVRRSLPAWFDHLRGKFSSKRFAFRAVITSCALKTLINHLCDRFICNSDTWRKILRKLQL